MNSGPHSDRTLIHHIRSCIRRIREYTENNHFVFFGSQMVQDAVVRNLQTMAESTQRLSDSLKESEKGVPWSEMAGFRNILVHGYLEVDLDLVWTVVERDLPTLAEAVDRMAHAVGLSE